MLTFMHGNRATSEGLSCTESVHVEADRHARKPCMLEPKCDLRHARVGVQHQRPEHAPQPCNIPCTVLVQHRTTVTGLQIPPCTYVQGGRHPLPDFTTTPVAQTSHVGNQQTARAIEVVGVVKSGGER